jgi:hypothetical protein
MKSNFSRTLFCVAIVVGSGLAVALADSADHEDWVLGAAHDQASGRDELHMIKSVASIEGAGTKLQLDLSCPSMGSVSAMVVARGVSYVWRTSGDIPVVGSVNASPAAKSASLKTSVRWTVGDYSSATDVSKRRGDNIIEISNMFTLAALHPWRGQLTFTANTNSGPVRIETSIDSPRAQEFWQRCSSAARPERTQSAEHHANDSGDTTESIAVLQSKNYFEKYWAKCGNSYYLHTNDGNVRQIAGVRFRLLKVDPRTEIDRLNGYEWKGRVEFSYQRYRDFAGHWEEWFSGMAPTFNWCEPQENVWKKNGEWDMDVLYSPQMCPVKPMSCNDVPAN